MKVKPAVVEWPPGFKAPLGFKVLGVEVPDDDPDGILVDQLTQSGSGSRLPDMSNKKSRGNPIGAPLSTKLAAGAIAGGALDVPQLVEAELAELRAGQARLAAKRADIGQLAADIERARARLLKLVEEETQMQNYDGARILEMSKVHGCPLDAGWQVSPETGIFSKV